MRPIKSALITKSVVQPSAQTFKIYLQTTTMWVANNACSSIVQMHFALIARNDKSLDY